jgi:flagellum-specific peptidoglycan hydrolase FlgJ
MYGNNFGGIKATAATPGASFATTEGFGAARRRVVERFRTYATPDEGARDYVQLLARRYPDAFEACRRGDLAGFADGLARAGYFTARPETYGRGLERLAQEHARGEVTPSVDNPLVRLLSEGVRHWLSRRLEDDE